MICIDFGAILELPVVEVFAVVAAEVSKIFNKIVNHIMIGGPQQIFYFDLEIELVLELGEEFCKKANKLI